jgi:hypothetical protein
MPHFSSSRAQSRRPSQPSLMRLAKITCVACLLAAQSAWAVPVEHYRMTFEVTDPLGNVDRLPSEFGDLSIGSLLHVELCWNAASTVQAESSDRYDNAICGYEIGLGAYTAHHTFPKLGQYTRVASGDAGPFISLRDSAPQLSGPDTASWYLDEIQFGFLCSSYGSSPPAHLDECASNDLRGSLVVGPLSHPNGFPCTAYCGAGGSIFTRMVSIDRAPVPESSAVVLLAFGALGAATVSRRRRVTLTPRCHAST